MAGGVRVWQGACGYGRGRAGMAGSVQAWQGACGYGRASAHGVTSRCSQPGAGSSASSFRAQFQVVKPISSLYLRGIFSDCIFSFKATAI